MARGLWGGRGRGRWVGLFDARVRGRGRGRGRTVIGGSAARIGGRGGGRVGGRGGGRVGGRGGGRVGGRGGGVRPVPGDRLAHPLDRRPENLPEIWVCCFGECNRNWSRRKCLSQHYKQGCHGRRLPKRRFQQCFNRFRSLSALSHHEGEGHIGHVPMCRAVEMYGYRQLSRMNLGPNERQYLAALGLGGYSSSSSSSSASST